MESKHGILTVLIVTSVFIFTCLPCAFAQDNNDENGRRDRQGQRMSRPGDRPGFRSGERDSRGGPDDRDGRGGPPRGGRPGRPDGPRRRPELSDEQIDTVLQELSKRDPNAAKELAELRKTDPNEFRSELRTNAWPEISKIIMSSLAVRRQTRFLEWLEEYVPKEAEELARLKDQDPNLYDQKYELTWRIYGLIYERTRRNPELAKVLVADLQLRERQHELQNKYRAAENEEEKNEIEAQLQEVVSNRYDLIVRQKKLEYEQLLGRLEALQNEVKASLHDIENWLDKDFKEKTVKKRVEYLTSGERRRGPFGGYRD
jgi:hypothetical protein